MKNRFTLLLLLLAWTMQGCANLKPPSQDPPLLQASLREPCADLMPPNGGSRAEMLRWSVETATLYRECQSKHARTVEAFPAK